jgi:hypothetical protein
MAEKTNAPRTRARRTAAGRSTGQSAVRPAKRSTRTVAAPAGRRSAVTLAIPVPTVTVRRVGLPVPRVAALAAGPASVVSTVAKRMPPPGRLLYYGGLGALAALDVVSWPVAAAIGGGVWVASRSRTTVRS